MIFFYLGHFWNPQHSGFIIVDIRCSKTTDRKECQKTLREAKVFYTTVMIKCKD